MRLWHWELTWYWDRTSEPPLAANKIRVKSSLTAGFRSGGGGQRAPWAPKDGEGAIEVTGEHQTGLRWGH